MIIIVFFWVNIVKSLWDQNLSLCISAWKLLPYHASLVLICVLQLVKDFVFLFFAVAFLVSSNYCGECLGAPFREYLSIKGFGNQVLLLKPWISCIFQCSGLGIIFI